MKSTNPISVANTFMVQRLAYTYLSPVPSITTLEGACITGTRVANRTSVPSDATTVSYLVEHPELGFSLRFRAVWREGRLFQPTATHVVIEQEWDDADLGSSFAVSAAINSWLQAVTP